MLSGYIDSAVLMSDLSRYLVHKIYLKREFDRFRSHTMFIISYIILLLNTHTHILILLQWYVKRGYLDFLKTKNIEIRLKLLLHCRKPISI